MSSPSPTLRALALALIAAVLGPAGAASADKLLFSGEHGIRFSNFGGFEVVAQGTGVAVVNGSAGGSTLNTVQITRPFATITDTVAVTGPAAADIPEVRLTGVRIDTAFQGGTFAPILGAVQNTSLALTQNTLPVVGNIRMCPVVGCANAISQSLGQTVSGMAVGAGVGGTFTIGGTGPTRLTVAGAPWTVGTTSVSYRTPSGGIDMLTGMGTAHGPLSMTGTTLDVTSMGMGGTLQLVTGTQVTAVGIPGQNDTSGQITRLTLTFAPEPGLLLLLGAGAVGVALLGRSRQRN